MTATSQATWASHARKSLAYWGAGREVLTITKREIQTWINLRAKEVKSSTIGHELCFLSRLWRIHEDRDLDVGHPCPLLRLKKPKKKTDKRKIDAEVVVCLSQKLKPGDRIAQLVFMDHWLEKLAVNLPRIGSSRCKQRARLLPGSLLFLRI